MLWVVCFRELLTPQQHYDWGLRALKTVLKGSGSMLQNSKKNTSGNSKYLSVKRTWPEPLNSHFLPFTPETLP